MKVAVLFSGGKDSTYAAYLAKTQGHTLSCLLTIHSENMESFMFHTPSISQVQKQADRMHVPLLIQTTQGRKEKELLDLNTLILKAKQDYDIKGVVTGAIESAYQASRIQKICDDLDLDCFNPLWQKDQVGLLQDLLKHSFSVMVIGVFAYPLNEKWLGRIIDEQYISEVSDLYEKYHINPAGEGGEFETFVLHCPLFSKCLEVTHKTITGKHNAWSMEIEVI